MTASLALAVLFAPSPDNAMLQPLVMFPLIFLIFYFLMVRPQQRQRKQHEENLRKLKKGDEVVTAGGIVGEVIHVKDSIKDGKPVATMEDRITIKSADSRMIVERGRIARIASKTTESSTAA
ncbi:MAG TPA: preprotein translocase subunit YajC [Gemmatimonadaceae bacterium]|nr:preprotein translocase subunit YajC [Gemmatimonadaceae bacterium]